MPASSEREQIETAFWQARLDRAEKVEDRNRYLDDRAEVHRFYLGYHSTPEDKKTWAGPYITVNLTYSSIKTMTSELIARDPRSMARPKSASRRVTREVAKVIDSKLAYNRKEEGYTRQQKKAVNEVLIGGMAIVKVEWDKDRWLPRLVHVRPKKILIDPDAEDEISQAGWVAETVRMKVADLKADPRFSRVEDLTPDKALTTAADGKKYDDSRRDEFTTYDVTFVWSKRGMGVPRDGSSYGKAEDKPEGNNVLLAFCRGHDFWLMKEEWPFYLDKEEFPYEVLSPNYTDSVWGLSPFRCGIALNRNINWLVSFILAHVRKGATTDYLIDESVKPETVAALKSGQDFKTLAVQLNRTAGVPPIQVLPKDSMSPDLWNAFRLAKDVYNELVGISEQQRGAEGKSKSATESQIINQRAQGRLNELRGQIEDWLEKIDRKVLMLDFQFTPAYTPQGATAMKGIDFFLGPDDAAVWKQVEGMTPEQVRAELDIEIVSGAMRRTTREQDIQDLTMLWNTFSAMYVQMGFWPELRDFVVRFLTVLDIPNPESMVPENFVPPQVQPTPEQVQQQQMMEQAPQQMVQHQQVMEQQAQRTQALEQAFQQFVQQVGAAIEQLKQQGIAVQGEARQTLQVAIQSFQTALQAAPRPPAVGITSQGALNVASEQTALTAQTAQVTTPQVGVQAGGVLVESGDVQMPRPPEPPKRIRMIPTRNPDGTILEIDAVVVEG